MRTRLLLLLALTLITAACSGGSASNPIEGELPTASPEEVAEFVRSDGRPAVVNVWASWCGPCRSEAPLLREAWQEYGDEVLFIGVDVQDTQEGALDFIEEFDLGFTHFFDPRRDVPAAWGGLGVPLTYYLTPDGEVLALHNGILDERGLVEGIENLLAASS
jgi:thiol-disulfide isomerase/thioredoxin